MSELDEVCRVCIETPVIHLWDMEPSPDCPYREPCPRLKTIWEKLFNDAEGVNQKEEAGR